MFSPIVICKRCWGAAAVTEVPYSHPLGIEKIFSNYFEIWVCVLGTTLWCVYSCTYRFLLELDEWSSHVLEGLAVGRPS